MELTALPRQFNFLKGSEMGKLILAKDWSASSLGPIEKWPGSLRLVLANLLHSSFPMFLFWGEEQLCFYNDAYRPSLGREGEGKHPAIGKRGAVLWPEIWHIIGPQIEQVMKGGPATWHEDHLVPIFRNGAIKEVYWTYSYSPAFNESGEINGVLVTCMETTNSVMARRQIEQIVKDRTQKLQEAYTSLIDANTYLQNILNLCNEPIQVVEPLWENERIVDFRFNLTNQAYASYANTTPEELKGRKVGEVFPGYFVTPSFTKPVETFLTGRPGNFEIHYDQDGLDLYNRMSTYKLNNEVAIFFTDFTKLKYLQLQLEEKIEELRSSNKQLEAFAYAASHDLKEPVRKIQIFTQRLQDSLGDRLTETERSYFERMQAAGVRMNTLIDALLAYSEVDRQQVRETIALDEVLTQVLKDLDLEIEQKKATIRTQPLCTINGYRRQWEQVFQNLIGNALKYIKGSVAPEIDVKYEKVNGVEIAGSVALQDRSKTYHRITVNDNGIGFAQKDAERIFDVFTRLHGMSEYKGSGIGLATVKKVVQAHNGYIWAESSPGDGACFYLLLPADE